MAASDPFAGFSASLFAGREVAVTGAAGGIGRALAFGFSRCGARLHLVDREAAALDLPGPARFWPCDLGDADQTAKLAQRLVTQGALDVLVNNAGIFRRTQQGDRVTKEWRETMAVNLDAAAILSADCAAAMPPGSAIVNIASTSALRASPGTAAYVASKAGLAGLTRALAVDLAPRGIRINAVAPGEVATAMNPPGVTGALTARIPLGRFGTAEEIAAVVLFLASPMASYVTGATWAADGGFTIG
ncbi:MAG: SDR family NAD(P)-dependent oxidoreductase [Rhodobacterales bacterium]|jgi:NAD(P)-dependent dehydrogenase (short-subunit alcohol dehydrogenase family)